MTLGRFLLIAEVREMVCDAVREISAASEEVVLIPNPADSFITTKKTQPHATARTQNTTNIFISYNLVSGQDCRSPDRYRLVICRRWFVC